MKFFILIYVAFIFEYGFYFTSSSFSSIEDCGYKNMKKLKCNCSMNQTNSYLTILCEEFPSGDEIQLPNISVKIVKVKSALTKWPDLPSFLINSLKFDFSYNRIDSIGDLSNCPNLQVLNCSYNRVISIPKSLIQVRNLLILDLSNNLIEVLEMESFMTGFDNGTLHYYLSAIRILNLSSNKIKIVNNMDIFFFGLPFLINFDLGYNQLTQINITISEFSNYTNTIIKTKYKSNINAIYSINDNQLNQAEFFCFYIGYNPIEYIKLGFKDIYEAFMKINDQISVDYLFVRLTSISFYENKIKCTCGLFEDFNFLVNGPLNQSKYFKNWKNNYLTPAECETSDYEKINLVSDVTSDKSRRYEVCSKNNAVIYFPSSYLYKLTLLIIFIIVSKFYY